MRWLIIITGLVFGQAVFSQHQADEVIGKYHAPEGVGKIEVYKRNGKYYGKATCCNYNKKDSNNPNPKLRNRNIIGLEFIADFEWDGNNTYRNGKLYYYENGKTYDCIMWLDGSALKVRGYIGFSALGKTVSFEKVK